MFLKTGILKAISFTKPVKLPLVYWVLVGVRFLLTLLPQKGYIHPDEFFQNVEVIAGDILSVEVSRTWEFHPNFPVRNIFVPKLVIGPPMHLIRIANPYTKHYLNIDLRTPYYLLVIPRLFICLLSFINDFCLYKICVIYGQNFRNRLKIFASSYVILVFCCRSFSNSLEMIFFSLLLWLVAESMAKSDKIIYHDEFLRKKYEEAKTPVEKVKLFKLQSHLPQHSLNNVFWISTIVAVGIFNRSTFVGYALPPIFFWLYRGLGSTVVGFRHFHYRIISIFFCWIPTTILLIIVDSSYYGYLTSSDVESLKVSWDNFVVTPLNFLRYNSDPKNLSRHGLHAWWMHFAVNVPLLFNILAVLAYFTLFVQSYRFIRGYYSKLPRIQSITGLMMSSLITPIMLLSMFPHQEARFIIPVLLPLVYLYGNTLYSNEADTAKMRKLKNILIFIWYALNIMFTLFYGFIHQAGIYPFVNDLHYEIKSSYGTHTHVITTHSYSIPTFLLQLDSTTKIWKDRKTGHRYRLAPTTFIRKYGSLPPQDLMYKVDEVLTDAEKLLHTEKKKFRFYVATPCPLEEKIRDAARKYYYIKLIEEHSYFPHFCTESLPKFPGAHDQYCIENNVANKNESQAINLNMLQRISCYIRNFCFKIYKVETMSLHTSKNTQA